MRKCGLLFQMLHCDGHQEKKESGFYVSRGKIKPKFNICNIRQECNTSTNKPNQHFKCACAILSYRYKHSWSNTQIQKCTLKCMFVWSAPFPKNRNADLAYYQMADLFT